MTIDHREDLPPLTAWAVVDLDAVRENIQTVRRLIPPGTQILLTVKADAYGLGAIAVSQEAAGCGVEMLGVATLEEGIELRRAGIALPILVLAPVLADGAVHAQRFGLRTTVNDLAFAAAVSAAARAAGECAVVHVEIDTGMGRTGVPAATAAAFIESLYATPAIKIEGIYTHFPSSNECEFEFMQHQASLFADVIETLARRGISIPIHHAANSAAILNAPRFHMRMVRPGLAVYGFPPYEPLPAGTRLRPAMSLRTRVVQVRDFEPGTTISYGRAYVVTKPARIAAIAIGYGHGISRALSDRGEVLVRGIRAPIVGRVTMDTTMIDVTAIPDVCAGDEAVLFGVQDGAEVFIDELAAIQGTISYEVTCAIGRRVARVYRRGGRDVSRRTMLGGNAQVDGRGFTKTA
ncbi:MAG: alanine racemase [bacterium]